MGFAGPLKRLWRGDRCAGRMKESAKKMVALSVVVVVVVVVVIDVGLAMRFAGPLKRIRHGDVIHQPTEMIVARRLMRRPNK